MRGKSRKLCSREFSLTDVMVARHFVPPFAAYDVINSKNNMATATSRCHFWVGVATTHC
jgi:hypothetical protein